MGECVRARGPQDRGRAGSEQRARATRRSNIPLDSANSRLGIVKDEKKAFNELSAAVESCLPVEQDKVSRALAAGLAELAGCYIEGSGVRKNAEVGLSYLRVAGNGGDVGVQEREYGDERRERSERREWRSSQRAVYLPVLGLCPNGTNQIHRCDLPTRDVNATLALFETR